MLLACPSAWSCTENDGKVLWAYEAQQSTNFSGWTIPVRFTATQYKIATKGSESDLNMQHSAPFQPFRL